MSDQDEKRRLIAQMGSKDNAEALAAVDALREKGWITDGSLYRAKLSRADLSKADLSDADLHHADLSGANLPRADLISADLSGADLSGADLSWANLNRAYLTGANLTEALCSSTAFADVDLSAVKGLDTVQHLGPSTVGINTLYNSNGQIPDVFLRGCGVPETLITYLPALVEKAFDFYSCFISYSHANKSFARRLHDTLQGRGIRCWLDEKVLVGGDDWREEINRGIRLWDKILVCCSVHSLRDSQWVDKEVKIALAKEEQLARQRKEEGQPYQRILSLVPLNLDGYLFKKECQGATPDELRGRHAVNFRGWDGEGGTAKFDQGIEELLRALRSGGGKAPPPEPKL